MDWEVIYYVDYVEKGYGSVLCIFNYLNILSDNPPVLATPPSSLPEVTFPDHFQITPF